MSYARQHLQEATEIIAKMDAGAIEKIADILASIKNEGGRVFFLGVGGSAGVPLRRSTSYASNTSKSTSANERPSKRM